MFLDINKHNLQFQVQPAGEQDNKVINLAPVLHPPGTMQSWDFETRSQAIAPADTTGTTYDASTGEIVFTSKTSTSFQQTYTLTFKQESGQASITLVTNSALHDPATTEIELARGSHLTLQAEVASAEAVTHHAMFLNPSGRARAFPTRFMTVARSC
ncbi:hypothetical protein [Pseudomonas poae]|uniref:hypothetical protein n=1 Tax=Pseudomonas poae TaxID=200451 RepID=UPI0030DF9BAE